MNFKISPQQLYKKDSKVKKEAIEILKQWHGKQPHLPKIEEIQFIFFYHCCYYQIEYAKQVIETYFTLKTRCNFLFDSIQDLELLRQTMAKSFLMALPKLTSKGELVFMMKLLDTKTDNFVWTNQFRCLNMLASAYIFDHGFEESMILLLDMKGFSLAHLAKLEIVIIKSMSSLIQDGAPIRVTKVHILNPVPFLDKIITLLKMFLRAELLNLIQCHSENDLNKLYESVPLTCLPEDYNGELPSINELQENNYKNIVDNLPLLLWHDTQTVDESKKIEKSENPTSIFGTSGTFQKLDLD